MTAGSQIIRPRVTCEARTGERFTEWGFRPLWCSRAIALGSLRDRQGVARRFCAARGHREQVIERFGIWDPEPEMADALTRAKARQMLEQGSATFDAPEYATWRGVDVEVAP
jgi:hypothetical protein